MNKDEKILHEEQRKSLWANAWVHVASAANYVNYSTATAWADKALHDFDRRFPEPKEISKEVE